MREREGTGPPGDPSGSAPAREADPDPGATIVEVGAASAGRYLLDEPLGSGSMGEVWRGRDPRIGRSVAVKLLHVPRGPDGAHGAEWEERFLREAQAAGRLSHPGIVAVHDVGRAQDGRPFIVMELVEGRSLEAILREGGRPGHATILGWGCQLAEALDAAHRRGVVHRDVKPANVLIDVEGRARLADFGVARLAESEMTRAGLFLGSPAYASPEQVRGGAVDGRSDLFSLGASLYAALTGVRPFRGDDLTSLAYAIGHAEPDPPSRHARGLPRGCDGILMKALAKDPGKRYQTGRAMAADLRAAMERPGPDPSTGAGIAAEAARSLRPAVLAALRATERAARRLGGAARRAAAGARVLWMKGWSRGPRARAVMLAGVLLAALALTLAAVRIVEARRETPATRIKKAFRSIFAAAAAPPAAPDLTGSHSSGTPANPGWPSRSDGRTSADVL